MKISVHYMNMSCAGMSKSHFLPDYWHSEWIQQVLQEAPHPLVPAIRINTHSCNSYKALLQGNSYKAATKNSHCQCCIRPKDHSPLSHSESPDQAFQCTLSLPKTWQRSGSRSSSKIKDQDQRSGWRIRISVRPVQNLTMIGQDRKSVGQVIPV